jgi:hypothetical protein
MRGEILRINTNTKKNTNCGFRVFGYSFLDKERWFPACAGMTEEGMGMTEAIPVQP